MYEKTSAVGERTPDDGRVSVAVIDEIAEHSGDPPTDLPALTECINPDALDDLFRECDDHGAIEFTYHGYQVRVTSQREITINSRDR